MKIGVDFGTSFSSAAAFINGEVQPITFGNEQQFRTAVFFPDRYVDPTHFVLTAEHEHEIDSAIRTQKSFYSSQMALYQARLEHIESGGIGGSYGRNSYSKAQKVELRKQVIKPRQMSDEEIRQSTINALRRRWVSQQRESIAQEGLDVRKASGVFGEDAIEALYNDEDGRIFQSPKSMLGYRLEPHHRDVVVGVISQVLAHIRSTASRQLNNEVTAVVLGRPVEFRGTVGSSDDQQTQDLLERAAREAGFSEVEFLREPSAAAYGYHLLSSDDHAALVVDIGGGTTDIAYAQVGGEATQPVIHQVWGKGFGGTDVDVELSISAAMPLFGKDHEHGLPLHAYRSAAQISALSLQRAFVKQDVARVIEPFKARLKRLKEKGTTVRLNRDIEQLKIDLSDYSCASRELDYIEPELMVTAGRDVLDESTRRFLNEFRVLLQKVRTELTDVVPVIFMTGGMSRAPYVQACVREVFAGSEVVLGDASLGVVAGLARFAAAQEPDLPARLMHEGANNGLSGEEIQRRDQRTDAAVASIKALENRFSVNLYSRQTESSLVPGMPPYLHIDPRPTFDEAWLDKSLDYIEGQVLGELAKEVLKGIESRPRNDRQLSGSAWAIAQRLCIYRYSRHCHETDEHEFDCDISGLRITLHDVMCEVHERLLKNHMSYRLWNKEALEKLDHYLHYAVRESERFIEGALSLWDHRRPATLTEFLKGVDEAIAELPMVDLYEYRFPNDYPEQVLFSEYVPAQNMTDEQKSWLYKRYLEEYAEDRGVELPVSTLDDADVRLMLEALEKAQAVQLQWLVPEGVSAEQAMEEMLPVLDNVTLVKAQRRVRGVLELNAPPDPFARG